MLKYQKKVRQRLRRNCGKGKRYEVASLLNQGLIYNDILERTGASSATISRVNRSLNYGAGGYEDVFRNLAEQQAQEEKHS